MKIALQDHAEFEGSRPNQTKSVAVMMSSAIWMFYSTNMRFLNFWAQALHCENMVLLLPVILVAFIYMPVWI